VPSIVGIVVATLLSYYLAERSGISGIYAVGISAVGMLSVSGMIVSSDAYGPIVDNARGIAEMAGMSHQVIETTDLLDAAGNREWTSPARADCGVLSMERGHRVARWPQKVLSSQEEDSSPGH
jgi:Na+/H+-translocating membrane pyrophosphatase